MSTVKLLMDVLIGALIGSIVYGILGTVVTGMNLTPGSSDALIWGFIQIFVPIIILVAVAAGAYKMMK